MWHTFPCCIFILSCAITYVGWAVYHLLYIDFFTGFTAYYLWTCHLAFACMHKSCLLEWKKTVFMPYSGELNEKTVGVSNCPHFTLKLSSLDLGNSLERLKIGEIGESILFPRTEYLFIFSNGFYTFVPTIYCYTAPFAVQQYKAFLFLYSCSAYGLFMIIWLSPI